MKKLIFSILSLCSASLGFAQVTLNVAHAPVVGDNFISIIDTLPNAGVDNGSAGTSQTYVVSDYDTDRIDTLAFGDPATHSNSADFPTANLTVFVGFGTGFLESSSSGIELLGLTVQNPLDGSENTLVLDDPETFAVYPSAFGNSYTDEAYGQTSFYVGQEVGGFTIDSARVTYESELDVQYDGAGTINNGVNTYSTLRERKEQITLVTIEVCFIIPFAGCPYQNIDDFTGEETLPDTTVTYSYYADANTSKAPIVALTYNANETELQQVDINGEEELITGIREKLNLPEVNVYPNPTINSFTIASESPIAAGQVLDISGKVLLNFSSNTVDIAHLPKGVYIILGTTENGELFQSSIQKK